jgi:hypothetical protein
MNKKLIRLDYFVYYVNFFSTMTSISVIPNIYPVCIELEYNKKLLIRAGYNGQFAISVTDKTGKTINIPENLEVYELYNQKFWDMSPEDKSYSGSLFNVYEIYYKNEPVLNNIYCINMEEYCDFNCSSNKYYHNYYTALCKGSVTKDSNIIKVSSTMDIDIGVTIEGDGIPLFATVTNVDDENNTVQINDHAFKNSSNITLTVR